MLQRITRGLICGALALASVLSVAQTTGKTLRFVVGLSLIHI